MYKKIVGAVLLVGIMSGCVNRDKIYANPPQELVEYVDRLMPEAEKFVNENESIALENGIPLTENQLNIATKVGVKFPDKVRVFYVSELPSPKDPELSALAKKYDYSSPNMAAYTYGALLGVFLLAMLPTNKDGSGLPWAVPLSMLLVFSFNFHGWVPSIITLTVITVLNITAIIRFRKSTLKVSTILIGSAIVCLISIFPVAGTAEGGPAYINLAWPWHFPLVLPA